MKMKLSEVEEKVLNRKKARRSGAIMMSQHNGGLGRLIKIVN